MQLGPEVLHLSTVPISYIRYIVKDVGEVNVKGAKGETALTVAAQAGRDDIVELLISRGADVNSQDELGNTALHHFFYDSDIKFLFDESRKLECLELLLNHGADSNAQTTEKQSPLALAIEKQWLAGVKCLIGHGADINARNGDSGQIALKLAAENKWLDGMRWLVSCGANINVRGYRKPSTLVLAVQKRWLAGVECLISHGANINARNDDFGQTALILAAESGWFNGVRCLVNHGADINAKDMLGRRALDCAKDRELREYLKSQCARACIIS